jgi:peptidoglycan/LPS O-acetylase OafA/YrhL
MDATPDPRDRLIELDALRGIGAISVVLFHYTTRFHEMFPQARHVPFHILGGDYRVLLFFALSGFVIFFSMRRLSSAADFVVGRGARLLPAYWVAIMLTLAVEWAAQVHVFDIPLIAKLANLTMLEGFFFLPAVDGAYWTLTVEIAFYACMLGAWMVLRLRHVERLVVGWLALKWLFFLWPDMPERIVMLLLVLRYMPFFAIGMVAYRIWCGERRWRQQVPVLGALLATVAVIEPWDILLSAVILIALFAAVMAGALRWLCVRPLLWFGSISYSLYLVHQHIGFVILLRGDAAGVPAGVSFAAALVVAVALGALVNRWVERPAARWVLARWAERRRTRPASADQAARA